MFDKLLDLFRHKEIRNRILFTLAIFCLYRLGAAIPVPKVDSAALMAGTNKDSLDLLAMLNLLGGGLFERFSIFAMGVGPYITGSIVIQLLSMDVIPYLTELTKTGAEGKRKLDQITRYFGLVLAFAQAYALTYSFNVQYGILADGKISTYLFVATILTAGSMFLLWIADRISMYGVGNGISMIIFAGIVSNYPTMFSGIYASLVGGSDSASRVNGLLMFVGYIAMFLVIILGVIFVGNAVRKIPIQYTSSNLARGRKDVNFLPLRINSASVIPVIFSSAIMTAPMTILSFFKPTPFSTALGNILNIQKPWGLAIYVVLIILFTFFYTNLQVDPQTTAENLNKNNTYIPGIRPGVETKEYITKVLNRITVMGAISIAAIGALPYLISMFTNLPASYSLGGTGIIIVVGVAQETIKDLMGQLTQKTYKGFKRKF